jgi:hypothetical protein
MTEQPIQEVTADEAGKLYAEGKFVPNSAPSFYATGVRISGDSNEFTILFQAVKHYLVDHPTAGPVDAARLESVAILSLSPQTAKDLALLLMDTILAHEKMFGPIMTSYVFRRTTEQAEAEKPTAANA